MIFVHNMEINIQDSRSLKVFTEQVAKVLLEAGMLRNGDEVLCKNHTGVTGQPLTYRIVEGEVSYVPDPGERIWLEGEN